MRIQAKFASIVLLGALFLNGLGEGAQDLYADPSNHVEQHSTTDALPGETKITLKEGTEVHLKLAQKLTSKTATKGELVEFILAEDLKVGEDTVARKGTRALGIVAEGKEKEKQRKEASQLSMRFDHMTVGNRIVQLRGQQSGKGKRNAEKMVTFSILFGLSGLLATSGKKFVLPEGTAATAYVDQDTELPVLDPDAPST